MIREAIKKVIRMEDLTEGEMDRTMGEIIEGSVAPSQVGSFLTALRMKGETVDEIAGAARALIARSQKLQPADDLLNLDRDDINMEEETILETRTEVESGTRTFNVSTATTFVAAGGGVKVLRHGNRTASVYVSMANVLENLGVNLDVSRTHVEECVKEIGLGFLFSPLYHGPMKYVAGLREQTGIRTIFNIVGPLVNPAGASTHFLGVYDPILTEKTAQVLNRLGAREAFVVCGDETLDEISICGHTKISHLSNGEVKSFVIEVEDYGFKRVLCEEIRGGNNMENARIIRRILDGEIGPRRDVVLLNAAAAFVVSGLDNDLESGIERAADVIDSGRAKEKLEALIKFSGQSAPFVRKEL